MAVNFGKYILLDKIATGGMAEIWLAKQTGVEGFEKLVVIKKILPHFTHDKEFVTMFLDEARIAAKLNHSNIVQIYDLGKEQNTYYIAMEYISGDDIKGILQTSIKQGHFLPLQLSVNIISQSAAGLYYAHTLTDMYGTSMDIVHRDISPQNILVTYTGSAKIVDFGIAKAATQSQETRAGTLKGKFAYMSPEQALGKKLDGRSDLFALAIVLYEITLGKRLFKSDSELKTLRMITEEPIKSPIEVNPKYPKKLNDILMKALERDRDKRYEDCRAFHVALDDFLREYPKPSSNVDLSKWMRKTFKERIESVKVRHEQLLKEAPDEFLLTDMLDAEKPSNNAPSTDSSNLSQLSQLLNSSGSLGMNSGTNSGYRTNPLNTSASQISYGSSSRDTSTNYNSGGNKGLIIALIALLSVIVIAVGAYFILKMRGCATGYTGKDCSVCSKGYYKFGDKCNMVKCPRGYVGKDCTLCDTDYQDNDRDGTCKPTCKIANITCEEGEYCTSKSGISKCVPKVVGMDFNNEDIKDSGSILKIPVSSEPSLAYIIINGRRQTVTTNTIIDFTIGKKYEVKLEKEGFKTVVKKFTFTKKINRLNFKLESSNEILGDAKLILKKSPKNAVVIFDGITFNNPDSEMLVIKNLSSGKHIIQVKLKGYKPETKEVILSETRPLRLNVKLTKTRVKYKDVTVKTNPSGALIYINNKKVGHSPISNYSIRPRKRYVIKAIKKGYKTERVTLYNSSISKPISLNLKPNKVEAKKEPKKEEVKKTEPKEVKKEVKKDTGLLTINTVPFTDIYLNNKKIGSTPLAKYKLPVGRHKLKLKNKSAMISSSINIRIKKDEELKQVIKFKKGTLKIVTNRNPAILINGRSVGVGTLTKDLYEGTYFVTIKDVGTVKKYTITIRGRRTETINY